MQESARLRRYSPDHIFVAIGEIPNSRRTGLDAVEQDKAGFVRISNHLPAAG